MSVQSTSPCTGIQADESGEAVTRVFFDGSCPLCQREVGLYRDLNARGKIHYLDVSAADVTLPESLSRDAAMRRFHVQRSDGQTVSGAAAFIALWEQLPGWRWLARLSRIPGVLGLMELSYRGFLRIRPGLQAMFRRQH